MTELSVSAPEPENEGRLRANAEGSSWPLAVWRKRKFVAEATLIGALLLAIVSLIVPKRYEATAKLMPPEEKSSVLANMASSMGAGGMPGAGLVSGLLGGGGQTAGLFLGILRSRTVEDDMIDRLDLRRVYGVNYPEDARRALLEHTAFSIEEKSGIITITVTDRDPRRAAEMANMYSDELGRVLAQVGSSSAHRERVFLEERLKAVKKDVDAAALDLSSFSSKSGTLDMSIEGQALLGAAANLQGRLIATEAELQGLREIYTENNNRVRRVSAQVEELRQQLERIGGISGDKQMEGSEKPAVYPSIRQLPILGQTYRGLYRRTMVEEAVFETLTTEYEMAKVQEAKEDQKVRVLDIAVVPQKKSFPPRALFTCLGGMLGFGFAVGFVVVSGLWKQHLPGSAGKVLAGEIRESLTRLMASARNRRMTVPTDMGS
jgi:uncharacterized protein involved in exopolysaccharide biosynthesis